MSYKYILALIIVSLLLSLLVIVPNRYQGIPYKEIFVAFFAYALYVILIAVYILRFALIFVGVFAVYRLVKQRLGRRVAI